MKYLILFVALFMYNPLSAQPALRGLGNLVLGLTTPDSLNRNEFIEDDQSYVKGTIALVCAHIRSFTATRVVIEGVPVTTISLYFYDNRLFKLSCDYSDALKRMFTAKHGLGIPRPPYSAVLCSGEGGRSMLIEGEVWLQNDVRAMAVQSTGYTDNCERENRRRLDMASLSMSALASDCELKHVDQAVLEFERLEKLRAKFPPEKN